MKTTNGQCEPCCWRDARLANNMTLVQVAEHIGATATHLSKFERGVAGLSFERVFQLCDLYGIDAGALPDMWRARVAA